MTSDEYRECIRAMGLTPAKPAYDGGTIHQGRDGEFTIVPNPETLSAEERASMVRLLKRRLGLSDH